MTSYFPMKKNAAQRIVFPILDADGDPVSGAAGLDSEVSIDGGAFADCTNEATEIGSSGVYYLDLTASETNGDVIAVIVKTTTSGAKTTVLVFYTSPETLHEVDDKVDSIVAKLPTNYTMGSSTHSSKDDEIDAIKAKTDNLPSDPARESTLTEMKGAGWTNETLKAIKEYVDELETRLTATRAAYLDNLSGGSVALASVCTEDRLSKLDAAISSRSSHSPADVWTVPTRSLTDKAGFSLSDAGIDAIIDEVVEGTLTLRQAIRIFTAVLAGKSTGGGGATLAFRDLADTKNRVTATVDQNGNRTSITLDGT